jgi:hypothetical protein
MPPKNVGVTAWSEGYLNHVSKGTQVAAC